MSDTPFSPEMRRKLDSFAPPPQAPGFADRVAEMARARAEAPPLPRLRRSAISWRRARWIVGSVAGLSLMSAAAAATGAFGDPVHVPIFSEIAQSLDIVPPTAAGTVRDNGSAARRVARAPATTGASPVRQRIDALLDDPAFRTLPRPERRIELRRTARELVSSGDATPREVVTALRETARERIAALPPEQREAIEEAVTEHREARREIIAAPPAERRQVRRQVLRERLIDRRERRAQRLEQEAPGEPAIDPTPPIENSEPDTEGSDPVVR